MARKLGRSKRGRFETLEQRHLLAGDVLVSVVNGTLKVQGDDVDNKILITAGIEAGSFVVTGLDTTTVTLDGTTASSATVSDVRNIKVDLGDDGDFAAVVGAAVDGKISIRTGAGDDHVVVGTDGGATELAGVVLPADLSVAAASLKINTSDGDDAISVDAATLEYGASINAGDDGDIVTLAAGLAVGDDDDGATWHRYHGYARAGVELNLGDGDDTANLTGVTAAGGIHVRAGDGIDAVNATSTDSAKLTVLGDDGEDTITLQSITARYVGVHAGDDNDNVAITDSAFTALGVALGDGVDSLTTSALTADVAALFGGDDEDTLNLSADTSFTSKIIRGFEIPPDVNVNDLVHGVRQLLRGLGRGRH